MDDRPDPRGAVWPRDQIEYLIPHYGRFPTAQIVEHLGRTPLAIRIMACRLRKEYQRVDVAKKSRNVSQSTGA